MKAWAVLVPFATEKDARAAAADIARTFTLIVFVTAFDTEKVKLVNPELN